MRFVLHKPGHSNTLVFAEDAGWPYFYVGRRRGPGNHSTLSGYAPVISGQVNGAGWADPLNDFPLNGLSRYGLTSPGPCPINCTNNNEAYAFHTGGINIGLCDGNTRFLSEDVTIEVYASLITTQGDEIVSID